MNNGRSTNLFRQRPKKVVDAVPIGGPRISGTIRCSLAVTIVADEICDRFFLTCTIQGNNVFSASSVDGERKNSGACVRRSSLASRPTPNVICGMDFIYQWEEVYPWGLLDEISVSSQAVPLQAH